MGDRCPAGNSDLASAFRRTGLTVREIWFRYLALGGNADELWVDAQLHGLMQLTPGEYNVVAHAVNEALDELPDAALGPKVALLPLLAADQPRRRAP